MNMKLVMLERLKSGKTRREAATIAGVSERVIRKYEEGLQTPSRTNYNKLAAYFGLEAV